MEKLGSDQFLYPDMPKMEKKKMAFRWMSFLQNHEFCFNQEDLPVTYHNFHHKSMFRPKSKSPNWQGSYNGHKSLIKTVNQYFH